MSNVTTLNLASIVSHHARLSPEKEAIVWNDMRLTYAQLEVMSNQVANALVSMGIGHNDKVALLCPNLPYFPIVYYGIMKAGAVVVPTCVLFTAREIERMGPDQVLGLGLCMKAGGREQEEQEKEMRNAFHGKPRSGKVGLQALQCTRLL